MPKTSAIDNDTDAYERWLRRHCKVVEEDLEAKHERMRKSPFDFLRASYFRWARTIETICPQLADAPKTLCVGDTHVENFGTWRDAEARLVWGINDFDEAAPMPYVWDLVRLATSARLAPEMRVAPKEAEEALLDGYRAGLRQPRPLLVDEHDLWLRPLVVGGPAASRRFWKEIDDCAEASPPARVRKALERRFPKAARDLRFARRSKGGGSLGRPRYIATALWQGGRIVHEAKALVPSAWHWARSHPSPCDSRSRSGVRQLSRVRPQSDHSRRLCVAPRRARCAQDRARRRCRPRTGQQAARRHGCRPRRGPRRGQAAPRAHPRRHRGASAGLVAQGIRAGRAGSPARLQLARPAARSRRPLAAAAAGRLRPRSGAPPARVWSAPLPRGGCAATSPSRIPRSKAGRAVTAPRHVQPLGSPREPIQYLSPTLSSAALSPEPPLPSRHPCWRRCCFRPACRRWRSTMGNPDLSIRWDNTVRLNYGMPRREPRRQDRQLGASPTRAPTASTAATRSPSASTCCPSSTSSGASSTACA